MRGTEQVDDGAYGALHNSWQLAQFLRADCRLFTRETRASERRRAPWHLRKKTRETAILLCRSRSFRATSVPLTPFIKFLNFNVSSALIVCNRLAITRYS